MLLWGKVSECLFEYRRKFKHQNMSSIWHLIFEREVDKTENEIIILHDKLYLKKNSS